MMETQVLSLSWKDSLEEEMANHSSILAWRIPWTKEAGGLRSVGSQRVRYDLVTEQTRKIKIVMENADSFIDSSN